MRRTKMIMMTTTESEIMKISSFHGRFSNIRPQATLPPEFPGRSKS